MKQEWNQIVPLSIRQQVRRNPLWIASIVCGLCGILLGSMLSRTLPHQTLLDNSIALSSVPSGLHQRNLTAIETSNMYTSYPSRSDEPRRLMRDRPNRNVAQLSDEFDCSANPRNPRNPQELKALQQLPLTRFRSTANQTTAPLREAVQVANFTNFGWRFLVDWFEQPALHQPIVVLHETVGAGDSVLSLFQTKHNNEDDQVSYHAIIRENGQIVYVVPPEYRAYGAGDSVFVNADRQEETVKTSPVYSPSVNNFAYHISLVTPKDGRNNKAAHSGYTVNQYEALAWLVAKTGVMDDRITTHRLIDRSGSRTDPRSFNVPYFLQRLHSYPRTQEIKIGCTLPDSPQISDRKQFTIPAKEG